MPSIMRRAAVAALAIGLAMGVAPSFVLADEIVLGDEPEVVVLDGGTVSDEPEGVETGEEADGDLTLAAQATRVDSGTWGTCPWDIDADGTLTIHPGTGADYVNAGDHGVETLPWYKYRNADPDTNPSGLAIKKIRIVEEGGQKVIAPKSLSEFFAGYKEVVSMDLSGFDVSKVGSMFMTFVHCDKLSELDLSSWKTASLRNLDDAFNYNDSLKTIKFGSGWDVSGINNYARTPFDYCPLLKKLDLTYWDMTSWSSPLDLSEASLDEVTVGTGTQIKMDSESSYNKNKWANDGGPTLYFSNNDDTWYTSKEIRTSRYGIADTYTRKAPFSRVRVSGLKDMTYTGKPVYPTLELTLGDGTHFASDCPYLSYSATYKDNTKPGTATVTLKGSNRYTGSQTLTFKIVYRKPTWASASKMPVGSTADISVTNNGWVRLKDSKGNWTTSDSVLSLSAPSGSTKRMKAKKAGSTYIYLLDPDGKQIEKKKITVYAIHGKTYEMESAVNSNYVLDIQKASRDNGAQMIVYKRKASGNRDNQFYQYFLQSDGTYAIRSLKSKKWLDVRGGSTANSAVVIQWSWTGGKNQKWNITVDAKNRVTFVNVKSGKCFDVQGGKTQNGSKMIQYKANGGNNQKWWLKAK